MRIASAYNNKFNSTNIWLLLSVLVAFKALVFFVFFQLLMSGNVDYKAIAFPDLYDFIAENIVAGNGYRVYPETSPTALRSPGYVLVLAGIFAIAGKSLFAVQVVNFLFGIGTAVFVIMLVRHLSEEGEKWKLWAMLAAFLALFHPGMMISESRGGVESLFALFVTASIYFIYRAIRSGKVSDYIWVGLVFGYGFLIRGTIAITLPVIGLFLLATARSRAQLVSFFRGFAVAGLVSILVTSPWIIRNYHLTGEFIPTMTVGGLAAFQGLYVVKHADSEAQFHELLLASTKEQARIAREMGLNYRPGFFPQFYDINDEVVYYRELAGRVKTEFEESPGLLLHVINHNAWAFWFQGRTDRATLMNFAMTLPLLLLAAAGFAIAFREKKRVAVILIFIVFFVIVHLPILSVSRFHIPLVPLLAILAALALTRLADLVARVKNE
jgi:4-amino-4-deoxy-L-arabinose transferase-like glycosyltransferase